MELQNAFLPDPTDVAIKLHNGILLFVSPEDADLAEFHWTALKSGRNWYGNRGVKGKATLLHRVIAQRMGFPLKAHVDHINGIALDCRRSNLRPATASQNHGNMKLRSDNTSGFKGVRAGKMTKSGPRWQASIIVNGKWINLGYYADKIEAAQAYDRGALWYFGAFARTNFPQPSNDNSTTQESQTA